MSELGDSRLGDEALQFDQVGFLDRIAANQNFQLLNVVVDGGHGGVIQGKIIRAAGQEPAALAGFGVGDLRLGLLQDVQNIVGLGHGGERGVELAVRHVGHPDRRQQRERGQRQPQPKCGFADALSWYHEKAVWFKPPVSACATQYSSHKRGQFSRAFLRQTVCRAVANQWAASGFW